MKFLLYLTFFMVCAFSSTDATFPLIAEKLVDIAEGVVNKAKNFVKLAQINDNEINKFIQAQETKKQTNINQAPAQTNKSPGQAAADNVPGILKQALNVGSSVTLSANQGIAKGTPIPGQLNVNAQKLGQPPNLGAILGLDKTTRLNVPAIPKPAEIVGPSVVLPAITGAAKGTQIPNIAHKLNQQPNLGATSGLSKSASVNVPGTQIPAINGGSSVALSANTGTVKGTQIPSKLNLNIAQKLSHQTNLGATSGSTKSASVNVPGTQTPAINGRSSVTLPANGGAAKGTQIPSELNLNVAQKVSQQPNVGATSGLLKSASVNVPITQIPAINGGSAVALSANTGTVKGTQIPPQLNLNSVQNQGQLPNLGTTLGSAKTVSINLPEIQTSPITNGVSIALPAIAGIRKTTQIPTALNLNAAQKLGQIQNLVTTLKSKKSLNANVQGNETPAIKGGSSVALSANTGIGKDTQKPAQLNFNTTQKIGQLPNINATLGPMKSISVNVPRIQTTAINGSSLATPANTGTGTQNPAAQLNLNATQKLGQLPNAGATLGSTKSVSVNVPGIQNPAINGSSLVQPANAGTGTQNTTAQLNLNATQKLGQLPNAGATLGSTKSVSINVPGIQTAAINGSSLVQPANAGTGTQNPAAQLNTTQLNTTQKLGQQANLNATLQTAKPVSTSSPLLPNVSSGSLTVTSTTNKVPVEPQSTVAANQSANAKGV